MRLSRIRAAAPGVAFSRRVATSMLCRGLLAAAIALGLATPSASALPDKKLEELLGSLWRTVLETPLPENPLTGGDPCVDLGGVTAPIAPLGTPELTCTVKPGTKLFVLAITVECSATELGDPEATEEELLACAEEMAAAAGFGPQVVTVDGQTVSLRVIETGPVDYALPADNILGETDPDLLSGQFVALGLGTRLPPLPPGEHEITIDTDGDGDIDNTTTIIVEPSGSPNGPP
ncbi:hypothetical protein [Polyangium sp. 15x6]|uniref:hypothetical protein n=1 Tax=Polyangium sp. 15x6 TaxID=3042687 RepID=UPI00249A16F6|nr:hypothetical protein [Polyangium sp. 15x6]MDI3291773.1 hypothetical protein [Polyangium sp. 15x6]